ncbi:MAG: retroviral-like aspartic protease family protein [Elainella sp. Prado103]|jgi:predicted aspartyl protease|nr:retroviral-like aspartic protease family protein [Elainella sp. Prado103]
MMLRRFPNWITPGLLSIGLLGFLSACQLPNLEASSKTDRNVPSSDDNLPSSDSPTPKERVSGTPAPSKPGQAIASTSNSAATHASAADPYQVAIGRASSAYTMGRSAQSGDDWKLVANRWQQAIDLMKAVPTSNSHHRQAQQKLGEYRQHLAHAQKQAGRPTQLQNPDGVIVLPSTLAQAQPARLAPPAPPPVLPVANPAQAAKSTESQARVFHAPIVRRAGNTPVVQVLFNGSQPFEMIVDTGASGTLITRQMANALGVVAVAQAQVDTASQKNVAFPLGYVQAMELGGARANNLLVAIAGPELEIGLLGHDFFGKYDVTIREHEVEFRERRSSQ